MGRRREGSERERRTSPHDAGIAQSVGSTGGVKNKGQGDNRHGHVYERNDTAPNKSSKGIRSCVHQAFAIAIASDFAVARRTSCRECEKNTNCQSLAVSQSQSESASTGVWCVPGSGAGFEIALEPSKLQKESETAR